MIDLFEKCSKPKLSDQIKELGIYPYFHALESKQDTEGLYLVVVESSDCDSEVLISLTSAVPVTSSTGAEFAVIFLPFRSSVKLPFEMVQSPKSPSSLSVLSLLPCAAVSAAA